MTSVLEEHLKKQPKGADGPWLVGGKFSFADLAFVPWQTIITGMMKEKVDLSEFKTVGEWLGRMMERKGVAGPMNAAMGN